MRKTALAGLGIVALVFAPWAAADVPGITQFVGSWYAHEEGLDIQPNGTGRETYATNRPAAMYRRLAAARHASWTSR